MATCSDNSHVCLFNATYCVETTHEEKLDRLLRFEKDVNVKQVVGIDYYLDLFECLKVKACRPFPKDETLKDSKALLNHKYFALEELAQAVKLVEILKLLRIRNDIFQLMLIRLINVYNHYINLVDEALDYNHVTARLKEKKRARRLRYKANKKDKKLKDSITKKGRTSSSDETEDGEWSEWTECDCCSGC